jgi:CTD nuclear envelope phosphatase 1
MIYTDEDGNEEIIPSNFYVRPYYRDLLEECNKYYEVAVFTAGYDWYANQILDKLELGEDLVQHRWYRQHCT